MDELAKAVQKKYVEDITKKYPLHRFFVLLIFLLTLYLKESYDKTSLTGSLDNLKIKFLFDFSSGLLASISFNQLVISIILSALIGFTYSKLSCLLFNLLSSFASFEDYIKGIKNDIEEKKSPQELINYFVAKDISKELEASRQSLKSFHSTAEISLAVSFCVIMAYSTNTWVEWLVLTGAMFLVLINQWRSFHFYISNFLPFYITEQTLLGSQVKFGDGK